jgi:hypothetical protein
MSLKNHPKTAVAVLVILALVAVGIALGLHTLSRIWAQSKSAAGVSGSSAANLSASSSNGVSSSPVVRTLMAQYGLNLKAATYLAGAKTQIVSQSSTSARLVFTFPDGATADETVVIQPDQQYSPTPEELAQASQSGLQAYNVKFSAVPDGPDHMQITWQYFVPYTSLPPDMQQMVRQQATSASWFQLVPSAWAQGSGGGMGVKAGFGAAKGVFKAFKNIEDAADKSVQNYDWMNQLDALEDCAKHPTNPVTQKAYQDNPAYRDQTVAGIEGARSVVEQVTAVRFLALENAVASGFVGGPFAGALGTLTAWNDKTLQYVANQQISDIAKSVTKCEAEPPQPEQGDGKIVYHMHRQGYLDFDEEMRLVQGYFTLHSGPVAGSVELIGRGKFQGNMKSSRFKTSSQCKGQSEISGGGIYGSLRISGNPVLGGCDYNNGNKTIQLGPNDSDTGFVCEFHNVDLVNGGSYEVHAEGEESQWAACALDLKPQQK